MTRAMAAELAKYNIASQCTLPRIFCNRAYPGYLGYRLLPTIHETYSTASALRKKAGIGILLRFSLPQRNLPVLQVLYCRLTEAILAV